MSNINTEHAPIVLFCFVTCMQHRPHVSWIWCRVFEAENVVSYLRRPRYSSFSPCLSQTLQSITTPWHPCAVSFTARSDCLFLLAVGSFTAVFYSHGQCFYSSSHLMSEESLYFPLTPRLPTDLLSETVYSDVIHGHSIAEYPPTCANLARLYLDSFSWAHLMSCMKGADRKDLWVLFTVCDSPLRDLMEEKSFAIAQTKWMFDSSPINPNITCTLGQRWQEVCMASSFPTIYWKEQSSY